MVFCIFTTSIAKKKKHIFEPDSIPMPKDWLKLVTNSFCLAFAILLISFALTAFFQLCIKKTNLINSVPLKIAFGFISVGGRDLDECLLLEIIFQVTICRVCLHFMITYLFEITLELNSNRRVYNGIQVSIIFSVIYFNSITKSIKYSTRI